MKKSFLIIISCLALALSTSSFSWWSKFEGCQEENNGADSYCSECQCTDLGYGRNDCMSLSEYCEAFGNVGGR